MSASHSNVGNVGNTSDVKKHAVAGFTAVHARGCVVCGAYGQWKHTEECPNRDVPVDGPAVSAVIVSAESSIVRDVVAAKVGTQDTLADGKLSKDGSTF